MHARACTHTHTPRPPSSFQELLAIHLSSDTISLVKLVRSTITRLTTKINTIQGKMGDWHTRLSTLQLDGGGGGVGGGLASASNFFDLDYS